MSEGTSSAAYDRAPVLLHARLTAETSMMFGMPRSCFANPARLTSAPSEPCRSTAPWPATYPPHSASQQYMDSYGSVMTLLHSDSARVSALCSLCWLMGLSGVSTAGCCVS
ncbi:hypothetical protein CVIRNUC_010171 [Coccomyxa viridis]|uniref:Uncharacterized protein n=1 Tax=Coccomyxa viridis TaxID=1274662 RepID=A0AAV1IL77_9CHLO|nr:hypothetical protein CVIRNUC_010171 [Coccomyxa viridis]